MCNVRTHKYTNQSPGGKSGNGRLDVRSIAFTCRVMIGPRNVSFKC